MQIKISLANIKQMAKTYKQKNPNIKHSEALNAISQKYGFEKYEILKAKADTSNGSIEISIPFIAGAGMSFANIESYQEIVRLSNLGVDISWFTWQVSDDGHQKIIENTSTKVVIRAKSWFVKKKKMAIIGGAGSGKTTLLLREQKHLDTKDTLFINAADSTTSFNGSPYYLEKESYEKHFKEVFPVFEKSTHKFFKNLENRDINKFNIFVIEESWLIPKNNELLNIIKRIINDKSKTLIMTFQCKEDTKNLGLSLTHIKDLRDYDARSTPLNLYKLNIIGGE